MVVEALAVFGVAALLGSFLKKRTKGAALLPQNAPPAPRPAQSRILPALRSQMQRGALADSAPTSAFSGSGDKTSDKYGGRNIVGRSNNVVGELWIQLNNNVIKRAFQAAFDSVGIPLTIDGVWRGNDEPGDWAVSRPELSAQAPDNLPPLPQYIPRYVANSIITVSFKSNVPWQSFNAKMQEVFTALRAAQGLGDGISQAFAGRPAFKLVGNATPQLNGKYTLFLDRFDVYPGDAPIDIRQRDQSL